MTINLKRIAKFIVLVAMLMVVALVVAIAFGGPKQPPPLRSISDPFKSVDFSTLPPIRYFTAEDGSPLGYRYYEAEGTQHRGSVVLVHGSSGSSNSMHVLAKAFAHAGFSAYALDIRGHGTSGVKGKIGYIGQIEDDLDAFVKSVAPAKPSTLVGFSSGGGFALRFAGSERQDEFQHYLLLSPYLSRQAPNARPNSGGWVDVGVPRIVAIGALHSVGIRTFDDLPILRFALSDSAKSFLTPEYSFALAANFQPKRDYIANIRAVHQPVSVVAGSDDEIFRTDKLEGIFREQDKAWPVTLVPGVGHISLSLDPAAVAVAVQAVENMRP